ncbi:Mu transposase C-terminal domain-containing protein [Prescottella equi]|nr:Mu transposase C-terminal domain-containing protein [Prescottella equi]
MIRHDPRDISRVWVLDPHGGGYLGVPYRTLSHPAVTRWEQRQAVARLRERGRREITCTGTSTTNCPAAPSTAGCGVVSAAPHPDRRAVCTDPPCGPVGSSRCGPDAAGAPRT